jgi:hypothetical protein
VGYVKDATDCDDANLNIKPGAMEVCDKVDNDCDGEIDEDDAFGASTWYMDSDGDTFGDHDVHITACWQPGGYVADDTDCDDNHDNMNTNTAEVCDGLDNDCDGFIDEDDAFGASTWYMDSDGDTFGTPLKSTKACWQPAGYVANNTDCDDTNPNINPNTSWYEDKNGDLMGDHDVNITACEKPDGYAFLDFGCADLTNDDECLICYKKDIRGDWKRGDWNGYWLPTAMKKKKWKEIFPNMDPAKENGTKCENLYNFGYYSINGTEGESGTKGYNLTRTPRAE